MSNDFRPVAPHLQVYKLPFSAIMSIAQRLSGLFMFLCFLLFSWIVILKGNGYECINVEHMVAKCYVTAFSLFALFFFVFALHALNGLRYVMWTMGTGYSICTINFTAKLVPILSAIITAVFVIISY